VITQCSIVELYKLGPSHQSTVDLAKTFERRKCNHREAIPSDDCIRSVVGETNKHRYVVATQSQSLRESLRIIPSVPIVHVNRVVMVLEPPSETTLRTKALQETEAQEARPTELAAIAATAPQQPTVTEPPRKKRKGPKQPNPLSVKKKKPTANVPGRSASNAVERDHGTTNATPRRRGADTGDDNASTGQKRKRTTECSEGPLARSSEMTVHDGITDADDGDDATFVLSHQPAGLQEEGASMTRRNRRRRGGRGISED